MKVSETVLIAPIPERVLQKAREGLFKITPAELQVLRQMTTGATAQTSSAALGISERTYEAHLVSLGRRTGCTRVLLMRCVFELQDDAELLAHLRSLPQKVVRGGAPRKAERKPRTSAAAASKRLVLPRLPKAIT